MGPKEGLVGSSQGFLFASYFQELELKLETWTHQENRQKAPQKPALSSRRARKGGSKHHRDFLNKPLYSNQSFQEKLKKTWRDFTEKDRKVEK